MWQGLLVVMNTQSIINWPHRRFSVLKFIVLVLQSAALLFWFTKRRVTIGLIFVRWLFANTFAMTPLWDDNVSVGLSGQMWPYGKAQDSKCIQFNFTPSLEDWTAFKILLTNFGTPLKISVDSRVQQTRPKDQWVHLQTGFWQITHQQETPFGTHKDTEEEVWRQQYTSEPKTCTWRFEEPHQPFTCRCDFLMRSAFIILPIASRRPMEMRALLRQVGQHTAVTTPAQLRAL